MRAHRYRTAPHFKDGTVTTAVPVIVVTPAAASPWPRSDTIEVEIVSMKIESDEVRRSLSDSCGY